MNTLDSLMVNVDEGTRTGVPLRPNGVDILNLRHNGQSGMLTMCEIAADSFTSSNTIIRSLENVENNFKVNCNWLPSHLSLDDFKSGKRFSSSGMSMCLINAVNHRIIDIIPERNNKFLRNYFIQYSYKARLSVM